MDARTAAVRVPHRTLAFYLVSLAISVAPFRAMAQTTSTVFDWGFNGYGALGNGSFLDLNAPTSTAALPVSQIAGGAWHNLALRSDDNSVWAWGDNVSGQLGNGSTTPSNVPVQVNAINWSGRGQVSGIAAGGSHSLAWLLASDGTSTIWGWGDNTFGQLGFDPTSGASYLYAPTTFPDPDGIHEFPFNATTTALAAGEWHSLAALIGSDGTSSVWAWGNNEFGQLGNGAENTSTWTPSQVLLTIALGETVKAIAAGDRHSLAVIQAADGTTTAWAWGNNDFGQLGDGSNNGTSTPTAVNLTLAPGETVQAIAAGAFHSLALTVAEDGTTTVWAWGDNTYGQLGDASNNSTSTPTQVHLTLGAGVTVTAIAAGGFHSLALDSNNRVWAWGENGYGELGDSSWNNASSPVLVSSPGYNATAIDAGWLHSLAIYDVVPSCETTVTTEFSPTSIALGQTVDDTATVSNVDPLCATAPSGTVQFQYWTGTAWASAGDPVDLIPGSGSSTATLDNYPPPAADPDGTAHHFRAVYVSDLPGHRGSTSAEESLEVSKAPTSSTDLLSRRIVLLGGSVTNTITISTSATGALPSASGTWTVEAARTADFSGVVTPVGSGTASGLLPFSHTVSFTADAKGIWYLRVRFHDDPNYENSQSGNASAILVVL
jgi:alpha-tubulin suppressor-like RCC1 family protein